MSCRPRPLGALVPTRRVEVAFHAYQATLPISSLRPAYCSALPLLRAAYSHSASVGSRYRPSGTPSPLGRAFSFAMNSCASFQLTVSTGQSSPHALLDEGSLPMTERHWPC